MPRRRRERRARTHEWQEIQQQTLWPEQEVYERLRPIVLFGETAASRAKETGVSERTLHYQADLFERYGMVSLFPKAPAPTPDPGQRLPQEMRQLIVDLKAEYPAFRPHEIARICYVRFGRKPSDHTVKRILAAGPPPSVATRRYPPYAEMADPYQRRRAIVDLHAQGWSNTNIAAYLQTPRHRVYEVLTRWVKLGHAGLDDLLQQHPRKTGIREIHEVGKLVVDSPELGAYSPRPPAAGCSPSIARSTGGSAQRWCAASAQGDALSGLEASRVVERGRALYRRASVRLPRTPLYDLDSRKLLAHDPGQQDLAHAKSVGLP